VEDSVGRQPNVVAMGFPGITYADSIMDKFVSSWKPSNIPNKTIQDLQKEQGLTGGTIPKPGPSVDMGGVVIDTGQTKKSFEDFLPPLPDLPWNEPEPKPGGGGSSGGYYPDAGIYINPEGAGQSVIPGFEPPKGTPYYGGIEAGNIAGLPSFSGDYTKFDESKRINPETGLPVGQSIISEDFGTKKDAPYKTSFWKGLTGSSAGFLGAIGIVPAWKKETYFYEGNEYQKDRKFKDILNPFDETVDPKYYQDAPKSQTDLLNTQIGGSYAGGTIIDDPKIVTFGDVQGVQDLKFGLESGTTRKEYSDLLNLEITKDTTPVIESSSKYYQGLVDTGEMSVKDAQNALDLKVETYVSSKLDDPKYQDINKQFETDIFKLKEKYPDVPGINTRKSNVGAVVEIAALSIPLTAPIVLATQAQSAPLKPIDMSKGGIGLYDDYTATKEMYITSGIIGAGAFAGMLKGGKAVNIADIEAASSKLGTKIKPYQVAELDMGSGKVIQKIDDVGMSGSTKVSYSATTEAKITDPANFNLKNINNGKDVFNLDISGLKSSTKIDTSVRYKEYFTQKFVNIDKSSLYSGTGGGFPINQRLSQGVFNLYTEGGKRTWYGSITERITPTTKRSTSGPLTNFKFADDGMQIGFSGDTYSLIKTIKGKPGPKLVDLEITKTGKGGATKPWELLDDTTPTPKPQGSSGSSSQIVTQEIKLMDNTGAITTQAVKTEIKTITAPKSVFKPLGTRVGTKVKPGTIGAQIAQNQFAELGASTKTAMKIEPLAMTLGITDAKMKIKTIQTPALERPLSSTALSTPGVPPIIPAIGVAGLIGFALPRGGSMARPPSGKFKKASRLFDYTPSFTALKLGITGEKTKKGKLGYTGFEVRNIIKPKTTKKTTKKKRVSKKKVSKKKK